MPGVISELRTQLNVSVESHELVRSHSDSIGQLEHQLQIKMNAQHELERQACSVAELKGQVRSCESSWRMELSHQVVITTPSLLSHVPLSSSHETHGVLVCAAYQCCA